MRPMEDSLHISHSSKSLEPRSLVAKNLPREFLLKSGTKDFSDKALKCISSIKQGSLKSGAVVDIGVFLLTTAALDIVRRVSRAKCPVLWRTLQAVQVFCYPPFNWIQKWSPFKCFIKHMKKFSRPMLVLTVTTEFSDNLGCAKDRLFGSNGTQANPEPQLGTSSQLSSLDGRSTDVVPTNLASQKWLLELHKELEKQGINLPERLNNEELYRFYIASNGNFSRLLSSVKKTIHWRQTYSILSPYELKKWLHLVFWHGYDVKQRPCLIIRLGLACSNLRSGGGSFLVKVVVSQVENRMMNLAAECPQITVLMDCEGLRPFGFPMQLMRSCAILLQDHYPNRLGYLIVVRLPPIARVIARTLFQVLRPATRQKLVIVGDNYLEVLSSFLQELPLYLGGKCLCSNCSGCDNTLDTINEVVITQTRRNGNLTDDERPNSNCANDKETNKETNDKETNKETIHSHCDTFANRNNKQVIRAAIVSILMFWIFIVFILAMHYQASLLCWQSDS